MFQLIQGAALYVPSGLFHCSYIFVLLCDLMCCVCVSILLVLHSVVSCNLPEPQDLMYKEKKFKQWKTQVQTCTPVDI